MSDITIKTYTTLSKSRSGNYSDGTTVVQSSGSVSYIGSGGSSVDIVKELGTDTLSDANVFSSLRTIKEITDRGHTHANKSALDNLTQTVIDNSHTHSNKSILDGITSALVSDWNNAVHKSGDESITGTKTFDNLKCTTSEFTGLMKAASITLTDILTAATINAATINQNGNAVLDASNYTNYTYSQSTIGSLIDTAKTAAINTAKESAASLYLPLSGGTMTGIITMPISYQIRWGDNTLMIYGSNNRVNVTGLLYANTGIHTASLATSSTNLVTNLNADMIDGKHLSDILASNVASATKLQTARTITINGDVSGSTSFDGSTNSIITASVVDDSHLHTATTISSVYHNAIVQNNNSYVAGSIAYIDVPLVNYARANRLAFTPASDVTVERSSDGGVTWSDAGETDTKKINLFTNKDSEYIYITTDSEVTTNHQLRVTVNNSDRYVSLTKIISWFSNTGHTCTITLEAAKYTSQGTFETIFSDKTIQGWSGPNEYNISLLYNYYASYKILRFTIKIISVLSSYKSSSPLLYSIHGYGQSAWISPNYLMDTDHMYVWDVSQNVTFPNNVLAKSFISSSLSKMNGGISTTTLTASSSVTLNSTLSVAGLVTLNGGISTTNITADSLSVKSFTADISQTLAGSDFLTKSVSKLSENFVIPAVGSSVRVIVDDLEGFPSTACFASGDYIRFRAFNRTSGLTIADAWGTVVLDTTYGTNGYSNGTQAYTFTCTSTACAGLTVYKGSEVLDYGTSGSGLIVRTTLDSAGSPYSQISTWQTDPSNSANYSVHVRLGNLAGLTNCSGYGLYTDNAFLTKQLLVGDLTKTNNYLSYDATNGLVIKGNLYAASGAQVATSTDVTNLNAAIHANASAISLCVTSTTYNQGIASCNTYADNAVSNLKIGTRNLCSNGGTKKIFNRGGISGSVVQVLTTYLPKISNFYQKTFTVSFDYDYNITAGSIAFFSYFNWHNFLTCNTGGKSGHITYTGIGNYNSDANYIDYISSSADYVGELNIYNFILTLGNKEVTFTPAPEDVDASIATKVATSTYDAKMQLIDGQISSKVSQTDFNALGQRVSSAESSITQLPNTIDARITTQVAANGSIYNAVTSSLTMTAEGISLFGKTIQLAGATTFVSSLNSTAHGYATTAKTEAISASLSNTTTAINNLNLSGRNLISQNFSTTQSTEEMGEEVWAIVTHNYGDGYKYAKSTRIQFSLSQDMSYVIHINLLSSMIEGKTYTFSFWYKCLGTTSFSLETGFISETSASTAWKFYSGNITMNSGESRSYIEAFQGIDEQADILISDVTLYEGTKYMGFNLSPEDVNDAMAKNFGYTDYSALNTAATAGTTIIKGGKINTALIEATAVLTTALAAHKITASDADITSLQAAIVTANYINSLSITTGNLTVTGGSHLGALTVQTDGSITNGSVLSISAAGKFTGSNVDITGKITATSGSIGAFSIDSYQLTATNGDDSLILNADLIRFLGTTSGVYIGADTFPSSNGGAILSPMRVEVNRSSASTAYGNIGSYYSVQGATSYDDAGLQYSGNNALYIVAGKICGSRFRLRRINTSQTLSKMDSFIITVNNSNTITITLPYGCEDGQWFEIKSDHNSSGNFIVAVPSGSSTTMYWTGSSSTSLTVSDGKTYKFVYDAVNDRWAVGISAL